MQRAPVTVEEVQLEKAVKEECQWENLPRRLQQTLPSKEEWHTRLPKLDIYYCVIHNVNIVKCYG